MKQIWTELKGEITIERDFNNPLLIMDITSREYKNTEDWTNTADQVDLTDIYGTFYPIAAQHIFSSSH